MIEVEIKCLAQLDNIDYIDKILYKTMKQAEFYDYERLHFAAHEALINSIDATIRLYGEESNENIKVKIMVSKDKVEIIIRDRAGGIPEKVSNRLNNIDFGDIIWEERGRGLLFIKHLVDDLNYYLDSNGDFILKLTKGVARNGKNK